VTTGNDLGTGVRGELWVRGPNVMRGYLKQPEASAATIDADRRLHTGDIGMFDEDGDLFIVDRLKELIKYKGFHERLHALEFIEAIPKSPSGKILRRLLRERPH